MHNMLSTKAVVAILAFLLYIAKLILKQSGRSKLLPPGPAKLPIIGNMNQLLTPLPHHTLKDLAQKHGPVMYLKLGQVETIVISSAEACREIVKSHDLVFSNRPKVLSAEILGYNYTDVGYAPYGPYWRQMRKICVLQLLSTARVQSFRPVREEEVSVLVNSVALMEEEGLAVNLTEKLFLLVHDITSRIAFGRRNPNSARFRDALREGVALAGGFDVGDFFPSLVFVRALSGMKSRLEKAFHEFDSIVDEIIDHHIKDDKSEEEYEDLVDILLKIKNNGDLEMPLTNANIKAVILDVFVGGSETTSITLEWAMVELIKNPRIMKKAQEEIRQKMNGKVEMEESDVHQMEYLKLVVAEALRLHPSLPLLIPRETTEPCIISGYEIPAKTRVIINNWAISRDANSWDQPETFYPERYTGKDIDYKGLSLGFIPFGAGRRGCPGISFGMANIELALASLLYYFDWKLPKGEKAEDLDMAESFGVTVTRKANLYLVPTLHIKPPKLPTNSTTNKS